MLPIVVIVAIGWIFVVLLMSLTETSFVAGIMTFLLYGVLPLSIIFYIFGSNARRRRRAQQNNIQPSTDNGDTLSTPDELRSRDSSPDTSSEASSSDSSSSDSSSSD